MQCELQLIELHEEEEELKTKLNQLASEYGRLELRHKVLPTNTLHSLISPDPLLFSSLVSQQHKDTVRHRDTQIRELADKLILSQYTGTKQFTASNVQSFIKEVDKKRQAMEKKAQKEKVSCEAEQQTQVLCYIDWCQCVVITIDCTID